MFACQLAQRLCAALMRIVDALDKQFMRQRMHRLHVTRELGYAPLVACAVSETNHNSLSRTRDDEADAAGNNGAYRER